MMGQPRQRRNTYSVDDDLEVEERHGARYIDEPKRESYLPDSVHGSQRQLSAFLAKNELVLVSEYGCPHVFLTLTCNPEWPKIQSQLINSQTSFDRPDVTVPVFKSRLDKFKTNIRNGKYFKLHEVIYTSDQRSESLSLNTDLTCVAMSVCPHANNVRGVINSSEVALCPLLA